MAVALASVMVAKGTMKEEVAGYQLEKKISATSDNLFICFLFKETIQSYRE